MSDQAKLQAWWAHKQGLDGSLAGQPAAAILEQTGWSRSVGGAGPYLTLFARAGVTREEADRAAAALEIHELPSARGCTYVLPASDFALGLRASQGFFTDMRTAERLGVTAKEIDRLCQKVVDILAAGAMDPDELKQEAGAAVRNLGEEGKKKGLSTTLPVALGRLQTEGEIRRIPINGRLDQQRYRYTRWRPNPVAGCRMTAEEVNLELARRYFRWTGPASLPEFQWFSGLGVKAAKDAIAPLKLAAVEDGRMMLADDLDAFRSFQAPKKPQYVLVSSLDGITLLRRDLKGVLAPADLGREVFVEKDYSSLGRLSDPPSHCIFDRGRMAGLWEFDVDTQSIAWSAFGAKDKELTEAVRRTEAFIRDQLGDARSFSLDSPKSRAPRVEALRGTR